MGRVEPQRGLGAAGSVTAVSLFTILADSSYKLSVLLVSSAALQAYDYLLSICIISDQAYVNMPRFSINDPRAAAHFHNLIINKR
ncbi:hypothetical protein BDDG_01658 [Blastomyces dermatitidis ATCC 18188]|uniref:Uncharacterized protein n=1 Tax=Ajellomyces dermatitidis (strain ATCC 18188 / CBS 674.68) TaxID=653446 RepID=F2T658_AJEDA|nr:hypothetical protein BDDG_01658 [Blastomyces dermatitidis ATCC 18188]